MSKTGVAILSTSKGVMSDDDARKNNLGGKLFVGYFNVTKIGKKLYRYLGDSSIKIEGGNLTVTGPRDPRH